MKTYKFQVRVHQMDNSIFDLQFELKVTAGNNPQGTAKDYVNSLHISNTSWFLVMWCEEVEDTVPRQSRKSAITTKKGIKIFNKLEEIANPSRFQLALDSKGSFCARNPINSEGFINWECPKMSATEIIDMLAEESKLISKN